jgi:hypothetical protein
MAMNLYASTLKGILAAKAARRRRLMEQMAAAAARAGERSAERQAQVAGVMPDASSRSRTPQAAHAGNS